jgi:renalase
MTDARSCLIIGAGMAGLTAAWRLVRGGWKVVLLDKGRRPGGRMATRRVGEGLGDHGAQFFTVRDSKFKGAVERWQAAGWVRPWFEESGHTRYRAAQGMSALAGRLAESLDIRCGTRVQRVEAAGGIWSVVADCGDRYDAGALLVTAPAPQVAMLPGLCEQMPEAVTDALRNIQFDPCFALLAALDGPSLVPAPGYVRPESGPAEWIADNAMKGISGGPVVTVHAGPQFSREYLEAPEAEIVAALIDAAEPWLGSRVIAHHLHRWRFSRPVAPAAEPFLFSESPAPVALAGDAFGGARMEGAFLSGLAAAERIAMF